MGELVVHLLVLPWLLIALSAVVGVNPSKIGAAYCKWQMNIVKAALKLGWLCVVTFAMWLPLRRSALYLWDLMLLLIPLSFPNKTLGKVSSTCKFCDSEVSHLGGWTCDACGFKWYGSGFARCKSCLQRKSWIPCRNCGGSLMP